VREQTRYGLSGGLSIVLHVLFVLAFAWSLRVSEDEPEFDDTVPDWNIEVIEFEAKEIEPDKAQGEPEPEEPEPEEPEPAEEDSAPPPIEQPKDPESEEPAPPEPEEEPEPKPRFGAKKSKVQALVPPNATWTLVLANERIKELPFRDSATELMAPLSDFQLLVDKPGFNIWEDFEYVVMGSPDATDQTQAFVAVQYSFGHEEMQAGIERGCAKDGVSVTWREQNGVLIGDPTHADPNYEARHLGDRKFVLLPGDNVAVFVREAFVEQVVAGPDASKGKTSANFVANIAKIKRYARAEPKAGVQVVIDDIRSMVRSDAMPFEIPSRAEIMWEAATDPELVIKLEFLETAHAERALEFWSEELELELDKFGASPLIMGFFESTQAELDQRTLILRHQFNQTSARVVLQMLADTFGKAMRWSKEEALAAKAEREKAWELREGGKVLPSEALAPDADEGEQTGGETGGDPAAQPEPAQPEPEPAKPEPAQPEPAEQPSEPAEQPSEPAEQPSEPTEDPAPEGLP